MLIIGITEDHIVDKGCMVTIYFNGQTFEVERDTPISDILLLITP